MSVSGTVLSWLPVPFAWGRRDCALFAADLVLAMTDVDHAAPFRGRYSTARGAARALRSNGARDLAVYVTRSLGAPIAPALAQSGDVIMFATPAGKALGVVVGIEAAAAGPVGVTWVPLGLWLQALRVV